MSTPSDVEVPPADPTDPFAGANDLIAAQRAARNSASQAPAADEPTEEPVAPAATEADGSADEEHTDSGEPGADDTVTTEADADEERAEDGPVAADVYTAIRSAVPALASFDTPDDAAAAVRGLYDDLQSTYDALGVVQAAEERIEGVAEFNRLVAGGATMLDAFTQAFPAYEAALDADAHDDVARAIERRAIEREAAERATKPYREAEDSKVTRWQRDAETAWAAFAANPPADLDAGAFAEWYRSHFDADATGRFRHDHFAQIARAYTYEKDMDAARAEAERKGYDRAVAEAKRKGYDITAPATEREAAKRSDKTDGVPIAGAAGTSTPPTTRPRVPTYGRGVTLDEIYGN